MNHVDVAIISRGLHVFATTVGIYFLGLITVAALKMFGKKDPHDIVDTSFMVYIVSTVVFCIGQIMIAVNSAEFWKAVGHLVIGASLRV